MIFFVEWNFFISHFFFCFCFSLTIFFIKFSTEIIFLIEFHFRVGFFQLSERWQRFKFIFETQNARQKRKKSGFFFPLKYFSVLLSLSLNSMTEDRMRQTNDAKYSKQNIRWSNEFHSMNAIFFLIVCLIHYEIQSAKTDEQWMKRREWEKSEWPTSNNFTVR